MLHVVVTLKQVVDPNLPAAQLQVDPSGPRVVCPFGIAPVVNGYDANALEAALVLKERLGARVSAICLGDDSARAVLKRALAVGADAVLLLGEGAWQRADAAGTGHVLAAAIRKLGGADLVLCGRQASDTDGGQVLFWLAQALGVPAVSPLAQVAPAEDGRLIVHRLTEGGHQRLRVSLPAVLGVSSEINEPRGPTMKGLQAAARARIPRWGALELPVDLPAPKVVLRRLELVQPTSRAELIGGASAAEQGIALADRLHAMGLV